MDTESPRLRLSILGIVAFSLFAALFVRLYYLQIMATDEGEVEAANNRVRTIQEEAPRGRLLDAKGRVLVDNRTSLVVTIDPHQLHDLSKADQDDLLLRLAEQLTQSGVPTKVAGIEKRLADPQYSPLQPIPVAIDIPEDLMVFLAEHSDDFPSVQVKRESVRHYPEGSMAAHVVGYVGRASPAELEAKMGTKDEPKNPPKPYEPDSNIGKTGIEKTFEDELRGTPGVRKVEVDRNGKVVRELTQDYRAPVPGNDVQLTIDMDVQRVTETKLADQLEQLRGRPIDGRYVTSNAGSATVLDPRNGNVVAMASYPTYDPTEFVNGISQERFEQLQNEADNALTNRAIAGLYAPGSTFKLVTAYAALEKGMITAKDGYNDGGVYRVGNRDFQNAKRAVNGYVQLPKAITVSSDVFFYWLGDRFWKERDKYGDGIQESARQFGYGVPTGIQLPGELGGVIPDPGWKKQLYESLPEDQKKNGDGNWYAGDNVNLSIGQGDVLATPLQIANSYATFAAKGVNHQPNLVLRILKPNTNVDDPAKLNCAPGAPDCPVVRAIEPVVNSQFAVPDGFYDPIRTGLGGVTSDPLGTAYDLFKGFDQTNFKIEGKTGTAQVGNKIDNSLFVGVAPADDPQYVAVAVLEQAGFGAEAAGPVVRAIFEQVAGQGVDPCAPPAPGATTTTTTVPKSGSAPVCPPTTTTTTPSTAGTPTYTVPQYTVPQYTVPQYTVPQYTVPTTAYRAPTTVPAAPTTPRPTVPPTSYAPAVAPTTTTKKTGG